MKCREFIALLLVSAMLSVAAGSGIGGESSDGQSFKVVESRNEAAVRFINDFVQVGAQQKVEGTEIVISHFGTTIPSDSTLTWSVRSANPQRGD